MAMLSGAYTVLWRGRSAIMVAILPPLCNAPPPPGNIEGGVVPLSLCCPSDQLGWLRGLWSPTSVHTLRRCQIGVASIEVIGQGHSITVATAGGPLRACPCGRGECLWFAMGSSCCGCTEH